MMCTINNVVAEVENVIAVVINNGTMNADPDKKMNVNSNLTKTDEQGCLTGDVNIQV